MLRLDEYLNTLEQSGLVPRAAVEAVRSGLTATARDEPESISHALVARRLLTPFQASKILQGRSGPFILSHYVIVNQLGEGGMGKVYKARDERTNRKVAIKVLPPKRVRQSSKLVARFQREANLSRRIRHPNVAQTLDVGQEGDVHYIVMEYIPGLTLWDMVQKGGPLRVADAARLFSGVAAGLGHIHAAGLVHRDIKPGNIMVTPDGTAKLLDLGLARDADDDESQLTRDGTVLGTMDYISPEQASDSRNVDGRADIYSLGCTLYYALAGHPPYPSGTVLDKLYKHRMEEPAPLERIARGVPSEFAALVRKIMAKDPADRYQTPEDLSEDLMRWSDVHRVKGLVGAEADSGQLFCPPPPEIDDTELQLGETSLRELGAAEPAEAPRAREPHSGRSAAPLRPPRPLERLRPAPATSHSSQSTDLPPEPASDIGWVIAVVAAIAAVGALIVLLLVAR